MTITMTTDYLTCGECLREFPLQCITLFIQHKKLDCDDETEEQGRDPKLQCNYCPQGFMTAWALLVHAQLTHNLKLFLEKASRSLGNPVRFSHVDQSGYPNMPLGFSPLNRRFGSSVTTYDATPRDEIVSSLQNKPNENIGTSLTPEKDKTIKQSNTKTDTQSIAANCQQQCKNVSSIVISRNIMTRPRQMGEMTKILECVGPEKNVDSSTNIPVCSNIQISPNQIPVSSNLQINTINTPVCSNIQISPGQIPVCSNIQINPDQIPVCSNLQISTDQIPVCSNLQISPDQIPVCSNLQISTTNTPVCSNIQITPDQIPVCSNIQITPDQIPVGSNIQISPDQIPVCSNLQISPDQIPVCSNLQISPGQIPVCSNLQISPDQIPVCSNLQISPDQIPVCSNLQINPDQIPACSNLQINPDQIPVCSNLQINPDQIPVCSNLQISPDQIPVCSNLQISPDQIPVCSNLQISPDQIPVCSNLQISPDHIPVCSNLQINPDQIPVCSNLQINPDQIPVCSNLQINPDQIPVCSNLQINPDQIPVCSNLQINPDQIPVCSNLQINPDQIPVCSNLQISPDQIPVCSNLLINLGILPITQTSLFPQCSTTPLTMFSDHIASQSNIGILPTVLCRTSFMSQPEPAIKTSAKMTYDAILKQKLSPQAVTTRTSLDNHESSNQSCFLDPATILPNSVTASPHPPSALPRLIGSSSDSSSDIMTSSAVCSSHAPNMDSSVDSTIPLFKLADDRYAKRQRQTREESSNIVPSNYMADIQIENPSGECCGSQGCGVTVIPGSHEDLQKCCNAVVPKKRKRHMEQKHTPFSWSSSRYARRKMLHRSLSSSVARSTTSQYVGKPSAGTIYIDLEPDSLKTTSEGQEGRIFKVTQSASPGVRLIEANDSPVKCSEKPVGQSKPHTMILKPGVVFSIPFTYIIPTSMTSSVTSSLSVSRGSVSFVDSIAQSGQSSSPASNQDQIAADDGNHTNLNMPDIVSYSSTVGDDQVIDPEKIRRHSTPKPFPCEKCAMAFNQRIHLKKHMSKHTGIKPYKCEECNYSTVERSHLKVHIRIHTGEKPFKCTFCEYATAQNSTLKIHLKRHHGGKMFQCQSCEKQFTQAEQLKGHKWEHGLKVVASPEQKAREDVKPGGLGTSPSQSSVPSRLSTRLSQNSSDGQSSNFPTVEVNTSPSTNQQAVSGHVDNLNEESTHWQGEESINQQAVFADVDDMTE